MAENKFPSGVGKKIVEALKKQAEVEIEIQPIQDTKTETQPTGDIDNIILEGTDVADDFSDFKINNDEIEQSIDFEDEKTIKAIEDNIENNEENNIFDTNLNFGNFEELDLSMFEEKDIFNTTQPKISQASSKTYVMPANVAVLKRLIMQLPQGVSKQTGAQIIRQTMEALGISMSSVLKEAQQGQDSITAAAKACLSTIAEYKSNIKTLEKQVQDYKKQAVALNDLISLFILTDKNSNK